MPWIKSHINLIRHKKLIECARELRIKPVYLLGHLHALWHVALEQADDGDISSWSDDFIAASACYLGDCFQFVSLLQNHGWLDGKLIHDWLDYAGPYLIKKYGNSNKLYLIEVWKKHNRDYGGTLKRLFRDSLETPKRPLDLDKDLDSFKASKESLKESGKPVFLEKLSEKNKCVDLSSKSIPDGCVDSSQKDAPPEDAKKRISEHCLALKRNGFNPFQFVQKNINAEIPWQVTETVLAEMVKHKQGIKDFWAYALTVLKKKYADFNYAENLKKHMEYKSEAFTKDVLKNLGLEHAKNLQ